MIAKTWCAALLCGAALTWPALAQQGGAPPDQVPQQPPPETEKKEPAPEPAATPEPPKKKSSLEDPPLHRWGGFTISLAGWSPALIGADDVIAVSLPTSGAYPHPITIPSSSSIRESWMVAYHLPQNMGSIVGHYDSMHTEDSTFVETPGQFDIGESLASPVVRGAFDDGLADAVDGSSTTKTRETRLEYSNTAWEGKHTRATWGAGVRNVDHNELLQVNYYALVPNLPPVIPPIVDVARDPAQWQPIPDKVTLQTDYSGTGVGVSLDVEFKLHPRFSIISGLSLGLLRGKSTSTYKSLNGFYVSSFGGETHYITPQEMVTILQTGTQNEILAVSQQYLFTAYYAPNVSQAGQTFDGYVGVQSMVWRGLRVFATFRDMYYQNVGMDQVLNPNLTVTTTSKSVGYEGYKIGASIRF
jgi:hypothetical protein